MASIRARRRSMESKTRRNGGQIRRTESIEVVTVTMLAVVEPGEMKPQLRRRFWIELTLSVVSLTLLALTLISAEWIELVFRVNPDAGSGELEWAIAGILLVSTLIFAILVRLEWRRAAIQVA
jgi:hypothetical protein